MKWSVLQYNQSDWTYPIVERVMDKTKMSGRTQDNRRIAGELTANGARKQIHDSLIPLHRLAVKHDFARIMLLLEEAIKETTKK